MLIYNAKNEPTASWKQLNPALPPRPFKPLVWLNLTHCLSRCKENSVLALSWWNEFLLAFQSARSSNKDWRHISSQTSALNPWKTWPKTSTCTVYFTILTLVINHYWYLRCYFTSTRICFDGVFLDKMCLQNCIHLYKNVYVSRKSDWNMVLCWPALLNTEVSRYSSYNVLFSNSYELFSNYSWSKKERYVILGLLIGPRSLEVMEAGSLVIVRLYFNIYLT